MKKAFTWLEENGVAYSFHDYKVKGITKEKINQWLKHKPLSELINKKGTTYRQLTDAEKESTNNTNKAISLMIANPSMIKRPLVETGHDILIGFDPTVWDDNV